jgi:phospholipid/cholesterol/gamma-HCH transport system permease protein
VASFVRPIGRFLGNTQKPIVAQAAGKKILLFSVTFRPGATSLTPDEERAMQQTLHQPIVGRKKDLAARWVLAPLGRFAKLLLAAFSPTAFKRIDKASFRRHCHAIGTHSFALVSFSAIFVGIALTIQTVLEMKRFDAQSMAGALISVGLLRELGPLIVGVAWAARIAAIITEDARAYENVSDKEFGADFLLPRYMAALLMAIPLSAYGLTIGFVTAALVAPLLGGITTGDFVESARLTIKDKDLFVYFFKLIVINPTVAVFAAATYGRTESRGSVPTVATVLSATFVIDYLANAIVTYAFYVP